MERKVLFKFEFEGRKNREVAKINRELFGYIDHSKHGKYVYRRDGLLSKYDIERVGKGFILSDEKYQKEILNILHSKGTKKIKRYFLTVDKVIG